MINTVFFGSSAYSVIILQSLLKLADFKVTAVVTKPDKPVGRHQQITSNPVTTFAQKNNLNLLQPEDFTPEFVNQFKSLNPDLCLVVAYGPPFFTPEMIDIPRYKIVNIHPSPLPKYRGATPGPWQIINGETQSSVTFFQIDALPDHGPIIAQIPFEIAPYDTADSFYRKAFSLAATNLSSVLKTYLLNPKSLVPQNHSLRSYFPKLSKADAQINWSWSPAKIDRFIRALNPWPIAWTFVTDAKGNCIKMKIFSAHLNNKLTPQEVQLENKPKTNWSQIQNYYTIQNL